MKTALLVLALLAFPLTAQEPEPMVTISGMTSNFRIADPSELVALGGRVYRLGQLYSFAPQGQLQEPEPPVNDDAATFRAVLAEQLAPMQSIMAEQLKLMQEQAAELKALRQELEKLKKGCK
jgi:hypothetical protein